MNESMKGDAPLRLAPQQLRNWPGFTEETQFPISDLLSSYGDVFDRLLRVMVSPATGGISPSGLAGAYADWMVHLALSPGRQLQLMEKAQRKVSRWLVNAGQTMAQGGKAEPCIEPLPQDRRFRDPAWQQWPYNLIYQAFLLNQQWWDNATTSVRGVTRQHEQVVQFATRQFLDLLAPSNFIATNPELTHLTLREGGLNLLRGARNFLEDLQRQTSGAPPVGAEAYEVGRNLAVTPGRVVYRNRLMELIQYEPSTPNVFTEPVLIIPAWIMKYYILDLSPTNSLVRYLVSRGFTVFMISWKNPVAEDREMSLEDYRRLGVMEAIDTVAKTCGGARIHAAGYCLGGTLLSIAAAAMAREGDARLKSMSHFAAQTDFSEAGELTLFINESQLAFLEDIMWEKGYLDTAHMAGAFQLLRSNDLVWSRIINDYLRGERVPMSDLMAWNADTTRMPYRMHSQYLRQMFLENRLSSGRYLTDGKPVALADIRLPVFSVGTTRDHVAPWRSVYKVNLLTDSEVTFVLTSGGHNAGIVAEPGKPGLSYRLACKAHGDLHQGADHWLEHTPEKPGSWWPEWAGWLALRSDGEVASVPVTDAGLGPAPGTYVFQR